MKIHKPKSHYRNMTPERAERIRRGYFKHRVKQTTLAEWFGISQGSVSRIVSGQVWEGA